MNKRERISQWLAESTGEDVNPDQTDVERHPYYRAFFRCWNEQQYYEAHDVLEQLWLSTKSPDADYFKGLIQAAGAFVHLQKHFEHPSHAKHSRRFAGRCNFPLSGDRAGYCGNQIDLHEVGAIDLNRLGGSGEPPLPYRNCSFGAVSGDHGLIV